MQKNYRGDYRKITVNIIGKVYRKKYTGFFLSPLRVGIVICKYVRKF